MFSLFPNEKIDGMEEALGSLRNGMPLVGEHLFPNEDLNDEMTGGSEDRIEV